MAANQNAPTNTVSAASLAVFNAIKKRDVGALTSLLQSQNQLHMLSRSPGNSMSYSNNDIDLNARLPAFQFNTPLLAAFPHHNLVTTLLKHPKVNVNAQDVESGYTLLHKALYAGDLVLALEVLRLKGSSVDLTIRDNEGNTCLDLLNSTITESKKTSTSLRKDGNLENGHTTKQDSPTGSRPRSRESDGTESSDAETDSESDHTSISSIQLSGPTQFNGLSLLGSDETDRNADLATRPATSVYTWGINSNYNLGLGSADDRAKPERVQLPPYPFPVQPSTLDHHQQSISCVSMSKYHTCVVADASLYMCGFGKGGRLGLSDDKTQLTLKYVKGLRGRVLTVALGSDHTIVVMESGEVFTFGSNKFGQLGYVSEDGSEHVPREVGGALKKISVTMAAASKFHSVVVSDSSHIYMWGLNIGQMGLPLPNNTDDTVPPIIQHPRRVTSFPHQSILQIAAINTATALLTFSRDVYVFAAHDCQKIQFPATAVPRGVTFYTPAKYLNKSSSISITKINSSAYTFSALTDAGDVYLWCPTVSKRALKKTLAMFEGGQAVTSNSLGISNNKNNKTQTPAQVRDEGQDHWAQRAFRRPKKVWSVRKKHFAARDVAVGLDCSVIIATESGHVFVGTAKNTHSLGSATSTASLNSNSSDDDSLPVHYKFKRAPGLQHIRSVVASPAGSFAAIRVDVRPKQLPVAEQTLCADLNRAVWPDERDSSRIMRSVDVTFVCADGKVYASMFVLCSISRFWANVATEMRNKPTLESPVTLVQKGMRILARRCKECNNLQWTIYVRRIRRESARAALQFTYSGFYDAPWNGNGSVLSAKLHRNSHLSGVIGAYLDMEEDGLTKSESKGETDAAVLDQVLYGDFQTLVRNFDLHDFMPTSTTGARPHQTDQRIHDAVSQCLISARSNFDWLADVELIFSDGEVQAHAVVLAQRCPFFGAILGIDSPWHCERNPTTQRLRIDVTSISTVTGSLILSYLYEDKDPFALEQPHKWQYDNIDTYAQAVISVLRAADELLLDSLKQMCSRHLLRIMNVNNALWMLDVCSTLHVPALKQQCLEFLCNNIETLIESQALLGESDDLIKDIQQTIIRRQTSKFAYTRDYFARVKRQAAEIEATRKRRRKEAFLSRHTRDAETEQEKPPVVKVERQRTTNSRRSNDEQMMYPLGASFESQSSLDTQCSSYDEDSTSVGRSRTREASQTPDIFDEKEKTNEVPLVLSSNSNRSRSPVGNLGDIFEMDLDHHGSNTSQQNSFKLHNPKNESIANSDDEDQNSKQKWMVTSPKRKGKTKWVPIESLSPTKVKSSPIPAQQNKATAPPPAMRSSDPPHLRMNPKSLTTQVSKSPTSSQSIVEQRRVSLRDIMNDQSQMKPQIRVASPTSPQRPNAASSSSRESMKSTLKPPLSPPLRPTNPANVKFVVSPQKMSQKEYKKYQRELAESKKQKDAPKPAWGGSSKEIDRNATGIQGSAWMKSTGNAHINLTQSFQAILDEEKTKKTPMKGPVEMPPSGLAPNSDWHRRRSSAIPLSTTPPLSVSGGSESVSANSSYKTTSLMSTSPSSFSEILREQMEAQQATQKLSRNKKSLMQIQNEERAVAQIKDFYQRTSAVGRGEWFSVKVVPLKPK